MSWRLSRWTFAAFALLGSTLVLVGTLPTAAEESGGPSIAGPGVLPSPGLRVDRLGQPHVSADGLDRPDADIYHEFGTVTPGGGARPRGTRPPNVGGLVIGPGGVVKPIPMPDGQAARERRAIPDRQAKPKPPTPEEKQAQIRKALQPPPPFAAARRKTLDDLYAKLAVSKDENEAKGLASLITAVWMRSGSDTANLLMVRAETAIGTKNYPLALSVLDKLVGLQPNWAEAWNKRAVIRYTSGDLNGAMADVDRVLKIEPNHFAAMNGLAMILEQTGFDKRALQVYRRVLAIYPHQPEIEKTVDRLSLRVEGQGI